MASGFPLLTRSFLESPVVDLHGYPYFVNPVSDGIPHMDRDLLDEIVDGIVSVADLDCDLVLAPEAMGIPLAVGVTMRTGIPYSVIRKRSYGLPGEIGLDQTTGYSESPISVPATALPCWTTSSAREGRCAPWSPPCARRVQW